MMTLLCNTKDIDLKQKAIANKWDNENANPKRADIATPLYSARLKEDAQTSLWSVETTTADLKSEKVEVA